MMGTSSPRKVSISSSAARGPSSTSNGIASTSSVDSTAGGKSDAHPRSSIDYIDLDGDTTEASDAEDDSIIVLAEDDEDNDDDDVQVIESPRRPKKSRTSPPAPAPAPPRGANSATSNSLLSKALHGAHAAAQVATSQNHSIHKNEDLLATPKAAKASQLSNGDSTTPSSAARAQFEQQMDFISFDFDDEFDSDTSMSHGARTPGSSRRGQGGSSSTPRSSAARSGGARPGSPAGSAHKRKLDEYEERREEDSRNLRKRERERSTPWCQTPGVEWDKARSAIEMLNLETKAFIEYISPTPVEHELRLWTIELIRRTIQSRWVDADVECFGSVGTGLYLPGGDIDLVVLCPTMPSPPLKPSSSLLHKLAALLLNSSLAEPSSLVVIAKARVPIVKFVTRYGGFSVDLSVNQENGVEAAVRVRQMLEDYAFRDDDWVEPGSTEVETLRTSDKGKERERPSLLPSPAVDHGVARSLVLLVKAFLNQRGMNEVFTGGLGSYSIICLVVSFLQLHPKIQTSSINPSRNVGLLFVEFLEYYGRHYNYDTTGITLRHRGGYFNKHDKGWFRANQPYLLSIEDPNDPTNDVSGGSHGIVRVRQTLSGGYEAIQATLFHRASHFAVREGRGRGEPLDGSALPMAMQPDDDPFKMSILGSVIGMSSAGIEARMENVRLYEDGTLQGLLDKLPPGGNLHPSGIEGQGLTKKQMKKLRKEVREKDKRDKTRAKLERRREEKKAKKGKKVDEEQERGEEPDAGAQPTFVVDVVGNPSQHKGAVSDLRDSDDDDDEDEDESRYAIASPRPPLSKAPTPTTYVGGGSSDEDGPAEDDSSDDSSEHDDADVMMGGGGGDVLFGTVSSKPSSSRASPQPPARKTPSITKASVPSTSKSLKQVDKAEDERKHAKAAFWAAKGGRDEAAEDGDGEDWA